MDVLNLTFINNFTWVSKNGSTIIIYINLIYNDIGEEGDLISFHGHFAEIGDFDIIINERLLRIVKINTNTTINSLNTNVGTPINLNGVVCDEKNNPLANIPIIVIVNGVNYNLTTNEDSESTLEYIPDHSGNIEISVSWEGNIIHYGFTRNTAFEVSKITTNTTIIGS